MDTQQVIRAVTPVSIAQCEERFVQLLRVIGPFAFKQRDELGNVEKDAETRCPACTYDVPSAEYV